MVMRASRSGPQRRCIDPTKMRLSHVGADVLLLAGEAQADIVVGGGAEGLLEGAQPGGHLLEGAGGDAAQ